jgi:cobyrinic acid a,c-diamide synthase
MAGVIPFVSSMTERRLTLGYRTVRTRCSTPLLPAGVTVRGHEFHWSRLMQDPSPATAPYEVVEQPGRVEGYARGNVLASYVHLHFGADPSLAPAFVAACAAASMQGRV